MMSDLPPNADSGRVIEVSERDLREIRMRLQLALSSTNVTQIHHDVSMALVHVRDALLPQNGRSEAVNVTPDDATA